MKILARIADWYTQTPDPAPELTFARFIAGLAESYSASAKELAQHDPAIR